MKHAPRLGAHEFDQLANATRLGPKAREMARLALVEGRTMHEVAQAFGTIPQRVGLSVGSIHRVQASLAWSCQGSQALPDPLAVPLQAFIAAFNALRPAQIDAAVIADLQTLLGQARQRIAGIA